ncbi:MAG: hypothetical protein JWP04_1211 [Belnapia sp.]|nr:hypothetical protein [Belnapia sp.]
MRRSAGYQAGASLLLGCMLAGCAVPKEVNPVEIYRTISGEADAGRLPPPGMDRPRPSLGSVPPRPERPPPEVRDALSAALAMDRAQSREPLAFGAAASWGGAAVPGRSPGDPSMPVAPPPRASLANAPAVSWTGAATRATGPRDQPVPGRVPEATPMQPPAMPDFAPAPPPPDLLGAPPRP